MKFMIDSGNSRDIKKAFKLGFVEGITTNPTILNNEAKSRSIVLTELSIFPNEKIFVQLTGETAEKMFGDFTHLTEELKSKGITHAIKVPITNEGLKVIRMIKESSDVEILGTAIYDYLQAVAAINAGCKYLAPYYNRIESLGYNANQEIADIRSYINDNQMDSVIVAASFKNIKQVKEALINGAHTCTLSYELLEEIVSRAKVDIDVRTFEEHHNIHN